MKIYLLTILIFSGKLFNQSPQLELLAGDDNEEFFVFFQAFNTIEAYQFQRIKFPLEVIELSEDLDSEVRKEISSDEWRFRKIKEFTNNTFEYYFSDFDKVEIPESDEMVYTIGGIENGTNVNYYFRRIEGKWYLIKIEDLST